MAKGGGSGRTPERVVNLLKKAVTEKGQSAVARESGLTQSAVHRYIAGIGEPSTETLNKLGEYFGTSVSWLRGDEGLGGIIQVEFDEKLVRDCNVKNMTKFFKKLSLPEQENVASMTSFFVALSLEQQQELISSLMQHYYRVHGMPSLTEPAYDADGMAE